MLISPGTSFTHPHVRTGYSSLQSINIVSMRQFWSHTDNNFATEIVDDRTLTLRPLENNQRAQATIDGMMV